MECSCEIDTYAGDGETVELYAAIMARAIKEYKCFECKAVIHVGTEYKYVTYKYGGEFWKERTCPDCISAINQFYSGGWYSGILWDDISAHVNDCDGDLPESCLAQLTPIARAKVCDMIDDAHSRIK